MAFFKRVEVWVLLALTVAGVLAVLRMEQAGDGGDRSRPPAPATAGEADGEGSAAEPPKHSIQSVTLERDGEFAVVEIVVSTRASDVGDGRVRLLRADGSEVPEFFVPFRPAEAAVAFSDAVAGAGADADGSDGESAVEVAFWADRASLAGGLTLDLGGEAVPVKTADGFDLDQVADGGRMELPGLAADEGASGGDA